MEKSRLFKLAAKFILEELEFLRLIISSMLRETFCDGVDVVKTGETGCTVESILANVGVRGSNKQGVIGPCTEVLMAGC